MSLTVSNIEPAVFGNRRVVFADIDFDSSYPAGGEDLTLATMGLKSVDFVQIENNSGYIFEYDRTNEKLKAFTPTAAQAAVTTDELTITASGAGNITDGQSVDVAATFRSAVDAAAADEVANAADLSGVTDVRVMMIGY